MESGGLKMAMMSSTTTKTMISHEEGEDMGLSLRLAPPGSLKLYEQDPDVEAATAASRAPGKRGFSETHDGVTPTVDWKLKLGDFPSKAAGDSGGGGGRTEKLRNSSKENPLPPSANDPAKPSAPKAQVVGWPPVRSFRKNMLAVQSMKNITAADSDLDININGSDVDHHDKAVHGAAAGSRSNTTNNNKNIIVNVNNNSYNATYVKVSMDGAPYLRKVDLKMYKSYQELTTAIQNMFTSFTTGMKGGDFLNESKIKDLLNGTEYVPTYEDQDGDWMLVGDVPWEMFIDSCKRLRIMKGSDAINGLAPRAVESKCKDN